MDSTSTTFKQLRHNRAKLKTLICLLKGQEWLIAFIKALFLEEISVLADWLIMTIIFSVAVFITCCLTWVRVGGFMSIFQSRANNALLFLSCPLKSPRSKLNVFAGVSTSITGMVLTYWYDMIYITYIYIVRITPQGFAVSEATLKLEFEKLHSFGNLRFMFPHVPWILEKVPYETRRFFNPQMLLTFLYTVVFTPLVSQQKVAHRFPGEIYVHHVYIYIYV